VADQRKPLETQGFRLPFRRSRSDAPSRRRQKRRKSAIPSDQGAHADRGPPDPLATTPRPKFCAGLGCIKALIRHRSEASGISALYFNRSGEAGRKTSQPSQLENRLGSLFGRI